MTFYKGKTPSEELRDICDRMKTCKTGDALVTVRLSTVRHAAVMLDKETSTGATDGRDQDSPQG